MKPERVQQPDNLQGPAVAKSEAAEPSLVEGKDSTTSGDDDSHAETDEPADS